MDSTMTIMVRVVGRQAIAQLNGIAAGVSGVAAAGSGGSAAGTARFMSGLNGTMVKMGKNLQWVGRQLTFNFTLPLVAAGTALFKVNNAIERSMIQVVKVYGDASFSAERVRGETDALRTSFELLSTRFGVHQEEVIDIAAAWASAGSAGVGLANNTKATMEAMILGEMDATQATEGLIAIQAVWQLSTMAVAGGTSELTQALAQLNVIENQTGIRFSGLIEVMGRAGGAARTAGMSIRELGAFAAALVPATGSAAQAGNALKTMISRLQSPTQETTDILRLMGIETESIGWGSLTATQKILTLADSFNALDTAAQNQVGSIIASRWQINRFSVLMRDVADENGYFAKAMNATADQAAADAKYQQELNTVLESSPQKWAIMTNAIRNSMAKAFIPLMPIIMTIIGYIAQLANAFENLDPDTKKIIMIGLAILALIGPVMQLVGAFTQLGGLVGSVVKFIGTILLGPLLAIVSAAASAIIGILSALGSAIIAVLSLPLWAVVAIVAAIVVAIIVLLNEDLRNSIWDIIKDIGRAFWALPGVIVNVFNAIIRILGRAIEIIRDALSYLNPFARHSPSLVDNVRAGVATILDEYMKFRQIPGIIRSAIGALNAFGAAAAPGARDQQEAELQGYQQTIATNDPGAGAAAASMIPEILGLQDQLGPLAQEIAAQAVVVADWSAQVAVANSVLEEAQVRLDAVTLEYQTVADAIEAAQDRIQELANTRLTGMQAMEDVIFGITMQQNELNLALVNFERQGYTIDSIRDKYAALNGEIEMLRGEQSALRNAGAGSDVLSVYDDQIAAIEAQREEMGGVEQQIIDIQNQLEELDLEKRFQELTQSITFDPLLREIDQMVNGVQEMSFDDVIAGIQEQQLLLSQLQPQYDDLAAAVAAEEANVIAVTAARDALQAGLDEEQRKLDGLNDAYTGIKSLIDEMTAAMRDYASAAADAAAASAGGGAGGAGLAEGDYGIQGGSSTLGAEGLQQDIEDFNKWMEGEVQNMLEGMGVDGLFEPLKKAWSDFVAWITELWGKFTSWLSGIWSSIAGWWSNVWSSIRNDPTVQAVVDWVLDTWEAVSGWFTDTLVPALTTAWNAVSRVFMDAWGWINDNVVPVIESMVTFIIATWEFLAPWFSGLFSIIGGIIQAAFTFIVGAIRIALAIIWTVFSVGWNALVSVVKIVWNVISGVISIAWDLIVGIVEGGLEIIRGIFDFFSGLFTGDWTLMWNGICEIFSGIWTIIGAIFQAAWDLIILILETAWDVLVALVETAWDVIVGLFNIFITIITESWTAFWDMLLAIVTGIWNAIWSFIEGIMKVISNTISITIGAITSAWDGLWSFLSGLWNTITSVASTAWEAIKNAIMNPIDTLTGLLDTAWSLIRTAAETAWNGISDFIGGIIDGISTVATGIWDTITSGVKGAVNSIVDAINWVIDAINSFEIHVTITTPPGMDDIHFDWDGFNIPRVPHWANGAIVDTPTLALFGEAGREVVIPLTNPRRAIELAQQSGLMDIIGAAARTGSTASNNFQSYNRMNESVQVGGGGSAGSTTIIQINGNLEFPNIKSGDDAKKLIDNLKGLAG